VQVLQQDNQCGREMTDTTEKKKLDVFRVLKAADAKNASFFGTLTEDEKKELQPFLVMRWMSGSGNAAQVYLINEFVNPYAFSLTNHKELLWQLLTVANVGKNQRYVWNKLPGKQSSSRPTAVKVVAQYYGYNTKEAQKVLDVLTREDVVELAEELGFQPDDITKLKRELKDSKAGTTKPKVKIDDLMQF
jgi:hypothetical protein